MTQVVRGGAHLLVGKDFYRLKDVVAAVDDQLERAGVRFPRSNRPPFFYTGCPYGDAILALGVSPCAPVRNFTPEHLPQDKKILPGWRPKIEQWARIFNIDPSLIYEDW